MSVGIFDRGLLTVYTVVIFVLSVLAILVFSGWWAQSVNILIDIPHTPMGSPVLWTIVGVLLLASLRLLYVSLRGSNEQRAVVHEYTLGQVRITIPAMEGLVKKVTYQIDGVREVKPRIITTKDGVNITIRVAVAPDINIPDISKQIQHKVKDYLLEITGISVQNVKVLVENISTNRQRVE